MSLFGLKEKRELRALEQRNEEQRAITEIPGWWPEGAAGGQAVASVSRALSLVPVFGAARTLADSIASLPINLYTNDAKGIPKRQPLPSLFAQPSIHGTLYDWLFRAVVSMALQGDAIGLVTVRDYYGFPTMVEWLNPEQVATQDGKLYGPGSYMNPMWWWWGRPINPKELVHVPWFTLPFRVRGLSPISAYQLTTNTGIGAREYQANWFGQGGVPPGTFKNAERTIDQKDADKLTAKLTARLQARQPLVFGRDWDYTPIAIKPHEALFIETCQLTATDIAVIYGLPPRRLGGTTGESMTYSTAEMDNLDYLTMSLRPWLVRFEYAFTRLFPRGYYVKFGTEEMLRVDAKTQAAINQIALGFQNRGWLDQDEVRASYDRRPLPKPEVPQYIPDSAKNGKILNGNHHDSGQKLNGNSSVKEDVGSNHNATLANTRTGRQALLELYAMRTNDPIGRAKSTHDYMRSRVSRAVHK